VYHQIIHQLQGQFEVEDPIQADPRTLSAPTKKTQTNKLTIFASDQTPQTSETAAQTPEVSRQEAGPVFFLLGS
jgi:hypothetical protein